MTPTGLTIIIAVAAVALFALGLSLTLIFKGHNIRSEIGENENMKKLGIKCAAEQMREEERMLRGESPCTDNPSGCTEAGCGTCGTDAG